MNKLKELYAKLPKEVTIFLEYILPSAILAALIEYLGGLELDNTLVMGIVNIILIFLRQLKPRIQAIKS